MKAPAIAVAAIAALLTAGCGASDPDAEIRALLAAAEEAAEARDVGFFRGAIGEAYRDTRGNTRDELIRMLHGYFIANQRIEIISRIDEIVLEGADAARVVVDVGMAGQQSGAALLSGVDSGLYRFRLELVNDGGDWQIIGADIRRATGD